VKSSSFDNITTFYALEPSDETSKIESNPANVNDLLMAETNTFSGWECWAGIQNITIDNQGDVWRAICRQGEKLGSIFTDFDIASDTVTCKKKSCTCAADLHLSKAAPGYSHLLREEKNKKLEKSFCTVPWVQLSTKTNGMYRTCCLMSNMKDGNKGLLSDGQGRTLRAGEDSFSAAMNSPEMRAVRLKMLNGERPLECKTCWDKEDIGLKSKRTVTNKTYKNILTSQKALETTLKDGSFHQPPSYFDLRFGNLCNIKCIMCHPASSSRWYDDYKALTKSEFFHDGGDRISLSEGSSVYDWHNSEIFWKNFEENVDNLKQIYLVGGEPLLIERHYQFLEFCIERGVAGQITLEYDTNLTVLRERVVDLWRNFKKVILRVSLEDVGERNDYIRFPSKWKIIEGNLQKVKNAGPNIEVSYSITWQLLNCLTIVDLWEYLGTPSSTRILSNPGYFDVAILPASIKKTIIKRLQNYAEKAPENHRKNTESFINYLQSHMNQENPPLLQDGLSFLDKMDQIRGTSFKNTFPELAELLNEHHCHGK
jgi:organic radical activating enzyme